MKSVVCMACLTPCRFAKSATTKYNEYSTEKTIVQTKELAELLHKRKTAKLILEKSVDQPHPTKTHWRLRVTWNSEEAIYMSFRGKERTWTDLNNAVNRIQKELQPKADQIILIHK